MSVIPVPSFIDRNPEAITQAYVDAWEEATGRPLHPAQVERLLIDIMAYREVLVREAFQDAAIQNLLRWARGLALDEIGRLRDVDRLDAQPALTTHRIELAAPSPTDTVVDGDFRVGTQDGKAVFRPVSTLVIPAGDLSGDIIMACVEPGPAANGYVPGQVNRILTPVAGVASASNLTATADGALEESDDHYRERIRLKPEAAGAGATSGYYSFHARSVSQAVREVEVRAGGNGRVDVFVLAQDADEVPALPSPELLGQIETALSSESVRSVSDSIMVASVTRVPWTLAAQVTLLRDADAATVAADLQDAAEALVAERRAGMGRDLVPSQMVAALHVAGVYEVVLTSPATRVVGDHEWADGEVGSIDITGVADG